MTYAPLSSDSILNRLSPGLLGGTPSLTGLLGRFLHPGSSGADDSAAPADMTAAADPAAAGPAPQANIGGINLPAPHAAVLPPTAPAHRPSLGDRLKNSFSDVQSLLFPSPDPNIASLLDPNAQSQARHQGMLNFGLDMLANGHGVIGVNGGNAPSLGQSIASATHAGQNSYNASLSNNFAQHQLGVQAQQQQQLLAGRQQIYKDIGMPPTTDPDALRDWVGKAIPRLMAIGDYTAVERLSPFADKLFTQKTAATKAGDPYVNTTTGETRYFDKTAGSEVPVGWKKVQTAGSGTPIIFSGTKNGKPDYQPVSPNDEQKMATLVAQGYKPDIDSRTQFVQAMTQGRADVTDVNKQVAAFDKLNAPITKAATMYPGFKAVAEQALAGNPGASKALTTQAAPLLDPSVQLRYQTLMYIQKIDPSFKGSIQRWLTEKGTGTLPPDQVRKVIEVVNAIRKDQREQYEARRADLISNFPAAERYAHPSDYVFGENNDPVVDPTAPAAPGAASDLYKKYNLAPRKP